MAKRIPAVLKCERRKGVTIAQAKAYWKRRGAGRAFRAKREKGAIWYMSGGSAYMVDRHGEKTAFQCENYNQIQSYGMDTVRPLQLKQLQRRHG